MDCLESLRISWEPKWEQIKLYYDEKIGPWLNPILRVVGIIFLSIATFFVFHLNPNFFVLGVVVTAVFPREVERVIEQVKDLWRRSHWLLNGLVTVAVLAVALPQGLALGAMLWSAKVTLYLLQDPSKPSYEASS